MEFDKDTIFLVGDAKAPQNNPITEWYKFYFLALVIKRTNGQIVEAECSATIELTKDFVRSLFIGRNMDDDSLIDEINDRYHGSSKKALAVAFKDAQKKYRQLIAALST